MPRTRGETPAIGRTPTGIDKPDEPPLVSPLRNDPTAKSPAAPPTTPEPSPPNAVEAAVQLFNEDWEGLNLTQKLARITGMIGSVQKRGYNSFHKYNYVMEADLVAAVRQYLAVAGIVIIPNAHKWEYHGDICMVDVEYTITDGDEHITFNMPGAGSDKGDKGVYKAVTGSMKYALMKLFKIETGDDPEGDTRVDERAVVAPSSSVRPPTRVTTGVREGIERGGHTTLASPVQIRRVAELVKTMQLSRADLAERIVIVTGNGFEVPVEDEAAGKAILGALQKASTEQIGQIIVGLTDLAAERAGEKLSDEMEAVGYGG